MVLREKMNKVRKARPVGIKMQFTMPEKVYYLVKKDMEENFMTTTSWLMKAVHAQLEAGKLNRPKKLIDLDN